MGCVVRGRGAHGDETLLSVAHNGVGEAGSGAQPFTISVDEKGGGSEAEALRSKVAHEATGALALIILIRVAHKKIYGLVLTILQGSNLLAHSPRVRVPACLHARVLRFVCLATLRHTQPRTPLRHRLARLAPPTPQTMRAWDMVCRT